MFLRDSGGLCICFIAWISFNVGRVLFQSSVTLLDLGLEKATQYLDHCNVGFELRLGLAGFPVEWPRT